MGTKFEFHENEFFLELSVCYVLSFRAHINCKAGRSTLGQAGRSGLVVIMMMLS